MEHFEDPAAATAEICRVLVPSGHYIALIHTDMSSVQRMSSSSGNSFFRTRDRWRC